MASVSPGGGTDLRLEKSRSAGTGAAPVVVVQADAGVTVPAAAATRKWCLRVELVGCSCVETLHS